MTYIEIPPLHKNQQEVYDVYKSGKFRVLVINAGRRFGKSTLCMAIAMDEAINNGKTVWWIAPTYKVLEEQWGEMKLILNDVYTNKNEVAHRLEFYFPNNDGTVQNGKIVFRSADKPNNLRGSGVDLIIIDEAAFQDYEVWTVIRPSITDRKGKVIFISTPNGYNWFYTFFQRGKAENREKFPKWWSKHYTSYDNEYIDPQEIDDAKADMTETKFRIEHLAEFIDDLSKVFTNIRHAATGHIKEPYPGRFSIGIDLARKHDSTVVSVFDLDRNKQVFMDRFTGLDWTLQRNRIGSILKAWKPLCTFADATAVGAPIVEQLQNDLPQFNITAFILTPQSKPLLIQKLALLFQNKQIEIISEEYEQGSIQVEELLQYEVKRVSETGTNYRYSAPKGGNDDTVIALALSIEGLLDLTKRVVKVGDNPFYPTLKRSVSTLPRGEAARISHDLQKELLMKAGLL